MNKQTDSNPYKDAWIDIAEAADAIKAKGIPAHEAAMAFADFAITNALVLGHRNCKSEEYATALIDRQIRLFENYLNGRPPFSEFNAKSQTRH